jgi:mono/diheme cytochrome c family protein
MNRAAAIGWVLAIPALVGCDMNRPWPGLEPSFERMMVQPRAEAYRSNTTFANDQVMRPIPKGAVAYLPLGMPAPLDIASTDRLDHIPIRVTPELMRIGRSRFEVVCATCHGLLGNGDSAVADRMALRRPPSLHEGRISGYSDGHLYIIASQGFGMMPSYAAMLSETERWAVVAYLRALQLSFSAKVTALPLAVRTEAERQLP